MSLKNFEDASLKALSAGAGTYLTTMLVTGDEASAPVNLMGRSVSLASAMAVTSGLASLANEYFIQDLVDPNLPKDYRAFGSVTGAATQTLTIGGASAGLLYASNPGAFSIANAGKVAVTSAAGAALGSYSYEKFVQPIADRYIF